MGRTQRIPLIALAILSLSIPACSGRKQLQLADNETMLAQAQQLIARRKLLQAVQLLGDVGLVTPVAEELDPQVKLALADAYFYQGGTINVVEAQGRYEQFLNFYPLHPLAGYARYQVGACLFEQSEQPSNDQEYSLRALEHFEAMARDVPGNQPWKFAARVMAAKAQAQLGEHEWLVGKYYFDRKRWAGAAGRFRSLIERFPGSYRRENAYYFLALTHEQLGDQEQARLVWKRQIDEFPNGTFAQAAKSKLGTS
jgi:outer membrane protein assembly factor BamD